MNKKKEVFIIIIATVLTFGVPIQTWADSNDSLVSNDVVFFDERDFEGIVEQILNIKSEHPEWMEQQVEDAMDVNAQCEVVLLISGIHLRIPRRN